MMLQKELRDRLDQIRRLSSSIAELVSLRAYARTRAVLSCEWLVYLIDHRPLVSSSHLWSEVWRRARVVMVVVAGLSAMVRSGLRA
jgi:hypothetical protein